MDIAVLAERFGENHDAVMAALTKVSGKADDAAVKAAAVNEELVSIKQRLAVRGGGGTPEAQRSWGEQVAASEAVKAFAEARERPGRLKLELKTITTLPDSGGSLAPAARDTIVTLPTPRLLVRDLLSVVAVSGAASVEYPKMTAPRVNNANVVAEGAAKPESTLAFTLETAPLRVIAHYMVASRQALDDAPMLRSIVDGELIAGVRAKEEAEIVLGDGTGQHLLGLLPQAQAFVAPIALPSPTTIDVVAQALLQIALEDYEPTGVILNPADWLKMRAQKASDGTYLMGAPNVDVRPQIWGVQAVVTKAIPAGTFLAGSFKVAATIYDRWQPTILVSSEHADLFVKNCILILGEERIGLAVKNSLALVTGTFA